MTDSGPVLSDMEEGGDGMAKYARMVLEFIKKDVFEDRKQVSVEEVVTLIAALTDISVSLLSRFRKDQVDPAKATEVGRDVFKYMVARVGFDIDKLDKSNIYVSQEKLCFEGLLGTRDMSRHRGPMKTTSG